jgi:hypothetical protein
MGGRGGLPTKKAHLESVSVCDLKELRAVRMIAPQICRSGTPPEARKDHQSALTSAAAATLTTRTLYHLLHALPIRALHRSKHSLLHLLTVDRTMLGSGKPNSSANSYVTCVLDGAPSTSAKTYRPFNVFITSPSIELKMT